LSYPGKTLIAGRGRTGERHDRTQRCYDQGR